MFRLIFLLLFTLPLLAEEQPLSLKVDLCEPTYAEGVLSTEKGGIIQGPDVRIQARKIVYSKASQDLVAEGDIILEFGDYYFIGDRLEFDFKAHEGTLYNGKTGEAPWYFGGEQIFLHADGTITLYNGFLTTSATEERDWEIAADEAHLIDRQYVSARDISFRIGSASILWIPSINMDLDVIFDAPIRYSFKWGGKQGVRGTMVYELFSWNRFKTFFRLDYRFKRGFGGGFETYYRSEDRKEIFNTINYFANDNSLSNPHEKYRYRFQGLYHNLVLEDGVSVDLTWDKLSDRDMATDYNDRGLELDTAGRTLLLIRKQEENRIEFFLSEVKVNRFQSVKQQLPTMEVSFRPLNIMDTGIISTSLLKASYLDFSYSNNIWHRRNYSSTRLEYTQGFFRPIPLQTFTLTPSLGLLGIYYGNSPEHKQRFLGLLSCGLEGKTTFSRTYEGCKHVVEPYFRLDYLTSPTVNPNDHYIFDIDDGWFQSKNVRMGILNQIFMQSSGCLVRPLFIDLFTYAFIDTPTIGTTFPKGYLTLSTLSFSTLRHTIETAWDFQHGMLDHFNFKTAWTVANDLAIHGEYRHRSPFCWRKADPTNFILDAFRSEKELLHSPVSDRRDTLLVSLFYQYNPNWALFFEARHGWNRKHESSYNEFEADVIGRLPSAWNIKLSYQRREDDWRVAVYFTIGLHRPNKARCEKIIPCLEF